jgi:hypothetical protein
MTPEDPPVPDDDAIAVAARGALGRLAGPDDAPAPWDEVRARGRRVRTMRYAAAGAAALLVVLAGIGTVSAVGGDNDRVGVAGPDPGHATTTTSSTTTTTTTTTTTLPSVPPPNGGGPSPTTPPGATPEAPEQAPTVNDFDGTIVVYRGPSPGDPADVGPPIGEGETVGVGETVIVTTMIRNISDHEVWPASTLVPVALATVCHADAPDARSLWWVTSPPVRPGEDTGRDGTFIPTERYVGTVTCELDLMTSGPSGDRFDTTAGSDEARSTIIGRMLGVPSVTFTVVASSPTTVPGSTTTAPGSIPGP